MNDYENIDLLLVEDRVEDAELAILALEQNEILNNIKWVKDGQQALDFLFKEGEFTSEKTASNPRLILLDIRMPRVGGLEVIEAVKNNERTQSIPIVALTTSREDSDRIKAYELGVNSYIVKPIDFENFSNCVRDLGYYWLTLNESPVK